MRYLTLAEVVLIHQDQLRRYGGDTGLRDHSLLSSALLMPAGAYGGEEFHSTLWDSAIAVTSGQADKARIAQTLERLAIC